MTAKKTTKSPKAETAPTVPRKRGGVVGHRGGNDHMQRLQTKRMERHIDMAAEARKAKGVMKRLERAAAGKLLLTKEQIRASEVYLDRTRPRLSAVEETRVNELDQLSREDILQRIQALIRSDPSLLTELVGMQARAQHEAVAASQESPKDANESQKLA
jgi:hypothetical protein